LEHYHQIIRTYEKNGKLIMTQKSMKAVVCKAYGPPDVLHITDVKKPEPRSGELLVKVRAVAVTAADSRIRGARFPAGFNIIARLIFGISAPRQPILGACFSGEVVAIGEGVTEFKVGDEVFGMKGFELGVYAEFITIGQHQAVVTKPTKLSHTQAAALVFGGTTALHFLRNLAQIKSGQHILINGASGSVGSSAVQIAKAFGARVTAVCGPQNIKLVKSLGADKVIDYSQEDIKKHHNTYDLVMDTVGNLTLNDCEQILKHNGTCLLVMAGLPKMIQAATYTRRSPKKIKALTGTATESKDDVAELARLFVQKKIDPVLTETFSFDEVVAAHRLVDTGHKVGNIVLKL
jgi:NADPH:quinone reductase-like Zn-dependent oxidoreductase